MGRTSAITQRIKERIKEIDVAIHDHLTTVEHLNNERATLKGLLADEPQEVETPQPRRRNRKKPQAASTDTPPVAWIKCPQCGESFNRPAVVNGVSRCPDCDAPLTNPDTKET